MKHVPHALSFYFSLKYVCMVMQITIAVVFITAAPGSHANAQQHRRRPPEAPEPADADKGAAPEPEKKSGPEPAVQQPEKPLAAEKTAPHLQRVLRKKGYEEIGSEKYEKAYMNLKKWLDKKKTPVIMDRIVLDLLRFKLGLEKEFSENFEDNLRKFRNRMTPSIKKVVFASEVRSFGNYEQIPDADLAPGKPVLIYCEIRNLTAEKKDGDYVYDFTVTGNITNALGARLSEETKLFSSTFTSSSYCTDIFIAPQIMLPKKIKKGEKVILRLLLTDNKAGTKAAAVTRIFYPGKLKMKKK